MENEIERLFYFPLFFNKRKSEMQYHVLFFICLDTDLVTPVRFCYGNVDEALVYTSSRS